MARKAARVRGQRSTTARSGDREQRERKYMIAVGQRVRVVREERGLTQHALSELTGVTTDMISRLENGRYTTPGLRTLFRIADGMGLTVSALLPDAAPIAPLTPEALLRARLATLGHRARPADLELIVELVTTIVNRGR